MPRLAKLSLVWKKEFSLSRPDSSKLNFTDNVTMDTKDNNKTRFSLCNFSISKSFNGHKIRKSVEKVSMYRYNTYIIYYSIELFQGFPFN